MGKINPQSAPSGRQLDGRANGTHFVKINSKTDQWWEWNYQSKIFPLQELKLHPQWFYRVPTFPDWQNSTIFLKTGYISKIIFYITSNFFWIKVYSSKKWAIPTIPKSETSQPQGSHFFLSQKSPDFSSISVNCLSLYRTLQNTNHIYYFKWGCNIKQWHIKITKLY